MKILNFYMYIKKKKKKRFSSILKLITDQLVKCFVRGHKENFMHEWFYKGQILSLNNITYYKVNNICRISDLSNDWLKSK